MRQVFLVLIKKLKILFNFDTESEHWINSKKKKFITKSNKNKIDKNANFFNNDPVIYLYQQN